MRFRPALRRIRAAGCCGGRARGGHGPFHDRISDAAAALAIGSIQIAAKLSDYRSSAVYLVGKTGSPDLRDSIRTILLSRSSGCPALTRYPFFASTQLVPAM